MGWTAAVLLPALVVAKVQLGGLDHEDPYPPDRVNITMAVEHDLVEGKRRFTAATRLIRSGSASTGVVAIMSAEMHFRFCARYNRVCRIGLVDTHCIMALSSVPEAQCFAHSMLHTVGDLIMRYGAEMDDEEFNYVNTALEMVKAHWRNRNEDIITATPPKPCTPESVHPLHRECILSLADRFRSQAFLFDQLRAAKGPGALELRPWDKHDLAFEAPTHGWGRMGFDYGADQGRHLTKEPDASALVDLGESVLEVAHSCLPVDGGVASMHRTREGPPDGLFCVWRRQHDREPALVEVYAGWLGPDWRPVPGRPAVRLTPGDDPRLFVHNGRVHAVYNDAWVGDGGTLSSMFPEHNSRRAGGIRSQPTVCVWLAAFGIRGMDRGPAAGASGGSAGLPPFAGAEVVSGRAQLVPPADLRAPDFKTSADTFPFGKNWVPFSLEGQLHFVFSLSPLVILQCPDLSPLESDPLLGGDRDAPAGLLLGAGARPRRVIHCERSPLHAPGATLDPRKMGALRGSTPAHLVEGGKAVVGLGHLRFNHFLATPFAYKVDLAKARAGEADALVLSFVSPEEYSSPVGWHGQELPAREANPVNFFREASGRPRLFTSLKRGTDFMVGSAQNISFQTALAFFSTSLLAVPLDAAAEKEEL